MSATKNNNLDSAKGPEWEHEMSDMASNMLIELLGYVPGPSELTKIVNQNSITLYSRDRYESITIVFTLNGQVLRHFISSAKAISGYGGVQTLNVWSSSVPASKAQDRLIRKYTLLLDRRMQSRISMVDPSVFGKVNFANEREAKYELEWLDKITSLLNGIVKNDSELYAYIEKNSFKLFSRDKYESIEVVLTPNGQVLRSKTNVNASSKNTHSPKIVMVWVKHVDISSARSILTKEIWKYFDERLGKRLYAS